MGMTWQDAALFAAGAIGARWRCSTAGWMLLALAIIPIIIGI
jgi:hypothetical protein